MARGAMAGVMAVFELTLVGREVKK